MNPALLALRSHIRLLERPTARASISLPFGLPLLDTQLPEAGLPIAALHDISGGGPDEITAAAATLFVAGILARLPNPVLWCATAGDIFAPGLAGAGLHPDRVIHACAETDKTVLLVMEEALRHPGLSGVVGELARLPMTASRRLVLAAEKSGVMALTLRRRPEGKPADIAPNAACTRWRITPLPSPSLPVPGLGPARWHVELTRCRGGQTGSWILEACDAQGRLALPAELAHGPAAQDRHYTA